ncbi:MAG TPA: SRPBCC family protein [Longimicrobium sp.]|nr:SRPBCC family protein [Longimicrobium sp.]
MSSPVLDAVSEIPLTELASTDQFVPAHATRSATLRLDAPPARVFPLFEPEGERQWITGWLPRYLWPADGTARAGTTFLTEHEGRETTWMLAVHDPGRQVIYTRVTAGLSVVRVEVRCAADGDGTSATVRYDYVGLTPAGNASIAQMTEVRFGEWMGEWERAINSWLATGEATDLG